MEKHMFALKAVKRCNASSGSAREANLQKVPTISEVSTKTKAIRGLASLTTGTMIGRGLRFVRNMILVRLLAEELFGVMGIVLAATIAFESLSEVGVQQSIIQNKNGDDPEYMNIAWWFQFIRGSVLFMVGYLAAPWIGSFYGNPEISRLLRVSFVALLFRGLVSPRTYALEKEYRFGFLMFIVQGSSILGTVATIVLAFMTKSVWALIVGYVAEAVALCLISHILVPFRPRFRVNREYLAELLRFARGMFGLPFLTMITWQTDVFMLGKLLPATQLGLLGMYVMAVRLADQPAWAFSQIFGRVLLPAFAEGQESREILRRRVRRVIRITLMISLPLVAVATLGAKPIISLVYTTKYAAVSIPFAILCITMFIKTQAAILTTIFLAVGQPHLQRRYGVFLAVCVICLMYPGITLFGVTGAASVLLLSNLIAICFQVVWVGNIVDLRFRDYVFWRRGTTAA